MLPGRLAIIHGLAVGRVLILVPRRALKRHRDREVPAQLLVGKGRDAGGPKAAWDWVLWGWGRACTWGLLLLLLLLLTLLGDVVLPPGTDLFFALLHLCLLPLEIELPLCIRGCRVLRGGIVPRLLYGPRRRRRTPSSSDGLLFPPRILIPPLLLLLLLLQLLLLLPSSDLPAPLIDILPLPSIQVLLGLPPRLILRGQIALVPDLLLLTRVLLRAGVGVVWAARAAQGGVCGGCGGAGAGLGGIVVWVL